MTPILDLQRRLHEAGRIRIGVTVPTGKGRGRPQKLTTFRITSQDRRALDRIAHLYGGTVQPWKDAPVGDQWEVITNTAELRVAVPPERMALSQSYELWSGGGCVRRCDGERQTNDEPCLCATLEADDTTTPRCGRHTRLSLMLADLATTGLWRLDTQGFYASEELAGAFELAQMLAHATGRNLLPGWLRLEQREIRRPGEQVKRFAVPVLDIEIDAAQIIGPPRSAPALPAPTDDDEPPGLTPIPADQPPSIAQEVADIADPKPPSPRRNAAAPIPTTGIKPRTAAQARAETAPSAGAADPATAAPASEAPPGDGAKLTDAQMKQLQILFRERGYTDRDRRLDWANQHLQRTILSSTELTSVEASRLIDALKQEAAAQPWVPVEPAVEPAETLPLDVEPASADRVQMIVELRRLAGLSDAWMRSQLQQLGLRDLPETIGADTLKRLSRSEAIVLSDAISNELDAHADDG
jgi:hypothetical protein